MKFYTSASIIQGNPNNVLDVKVLDKLILTVA